MNSDQIWSMPKNKEKDFFFSYFLATASPFRELAERDDVTSFRYLKNIKKINLFFFFFSGGLTIIELLIYSPLFPYCVYFFFSEMKQ